MTDRGFVLTVTDLNDYVRRSLAGDPILQNISLRGEISNFKHHVSGHLYFSLKDQQSKIDCVMFRQDAMRLEFEPQDGMKVILRGTPSLYVAGGSYQFYTNGMEQEGLGELYIRFEALKKRLAGEGLFDVSLKKPLPLLPRVVGVVTARTGAVIHDIARVAGRRNPNVQILLRPSQVQGEGAAQDIAEGIRELSGAADVDVIIIGRGGGSMEDLWAFNEEIVVRAIAACPIPVISAVGHETDVTLSDFAADVRAATPSAAAELAVQPRETLLAMIEEKRSRVFAAAYNRVSDGHMTLRGIEKRLALCHPMVKVQTVRAQTQAFEQKLHEIMDKRLSDAAARVRLNQNKLMVLGPQSALNRGYAIALKDGQPVMSVQDARGDLSLLLKDGRAKVQVISAEGGDPFGKGDV